MTLLFTKLNVQGFIRKLFEVQRVHKHNLESFIEKLNTQNPENSRTKLMINLRVPKSNCKTTIPDRATMSVTERP